MFSFLTVREGLPSNNGNIVARILILVWPLSMSKALDFWSKCGAGSQIDSLPLQPLFWNPPYKQYIASLSAVLETVLWFPVVRSRCLHFADRRFLEEPPHLRVFGSRLSMTAAGTFFLDSRNIVYTSIQVLSITLLWSLKSMKERSGFPGGLYTLIEWLYLIRASERATTKRWTCCHRGSSRRCLERVIGLYDECSMLLLIALKT
jgi:hypothetical protein